MPVQVKTAQPAKVNDTTEYVATLKSRDSAVIMPQVEGIITEIFDHPPHIRSERLLKFSAKFSEGLS